MAGASQVKRRGIAMLLVLVCLFTATIIATSYLASRDNSAAIGSNVTEASAARWSAASPSSESPSACPVTEGPLPPEGPALSSSVGVSSPDPSEIKGFSGRT